MTSRLSPLLALACLIPAAGFAAPTDAEMAAMQQRLLAMEARLAQMQAKLNALQPPAAKTATATAAEAAIAGTGPSGGWGDDKPAPVTREEVDQLRQKVARQGMKVEKLFTDAYDGPGANLTITGYIDPTYMVNRAQKTASFQFLNQGDPYTYDDSSQGDVFLRITQTFGEGALAPKMDLELAPTRGYGAANTNSQGYVVPTFIHVAQATIPLDAQWSVTAGRTGGFAGYEYYESTLTNTLTHNLLYDFSLAGNMSGAGFNWTNAAQDWAWKFYLSNEEYYAKGSHPYDAKANRAPTLAARFDYTASTALYYGGSLMLGRNTLYTTDAYCDPGFHGYQCATTHAYGNKMSADLDMTYQAADVQYNAQVDYGQWTNGAWNGGNARWWGVSALAHWRATSPALGRHGWTVRADYLDDAHNGGGSPSLFLGTTNASTGTVGTDPLNGFGISPACYAAKAELDNGASCSGTRRFALTGTFLLLPTDQWTIKAELRWDHASHAVFGTDGPGYRKDNQVFGVQSVYAF